MCCTPGLHAKLCADWVAVYDDTKPPALMVLVSFTYKFHWRMALCLTVGMLPTHTALHLVTIVERADCVNLFVYAPGRMTTFQQQG